MQSRLLFKVLQLRQRLWAKPALYCFLAIIAAFVAQVADRTPIGDALPEVAPETIQTLLTIISSSMLAVATFAVGSMLASYSSASSSATPRAFALVIADDVSQTALSSFIGAFIFSIVAIVALKSGLYERGGLFVLFLLTLTIFAWVVLTFVRWVDSIARLGRLSTTIDKAEAAALQSMNERRRRPFLGGVRKTSGNSLEGESVHCRKIGYIQHIDMEHLQRVASDHDLHVMIEAMSGTFLAPGRPLVRLDSGKPGDEDFANRIADAFVIGENRTFEGDPRFGLIVLAEIAARALSPAVNDPGTAIVIVGRFVRLLANWAEPVPRDERDECRFDRVIVPEITVSEMFDDAFTAISRDGAGSVEFGIRLQKAYAALSTIDHPGMKEAAREHSALSIKRAKQKLTLDEDVDRLTRIAASVQ